MSDQNQNDIDKIVAQDGLKGEINTTTLLEDLDEAAVSFITNKYNVNILNTIVKNINMVKLIKNKGDHYVEFANIPMISSFADVSKYNRMTIGNGKVIIHCDDFLRNNEVVMDDKTMTIHIRMSDHVFKIVYVYNAEYRKSFKNMNWAMGEFISMRDYTSDALRNFDENKTTNTIERPSTTYNIGFTSDHVRQVCDLIAPTLPNLFNMAKNIIENKENAKLVLCP